MYNYIPPCRCKLYARVNTCALFVAVDEVGSRSVVSMGLSVRYNYIEKLSFIVPNVASRACLYTIPSRMNYECARAMRSMYAIYNNRLTC